MNVNRNQNSLNKWIEKEYMRKVGRKGKRKEGG
jgi:hypothetical protein